jgi:DNA-binding MarR family transcriptional regulator
MLRGPYTVGSLREVARHAAQGSPITDVTPALARLEALGLVEEASRLYVMRDGMRRATGLVLTPAGQQMLESAERGRAQGATLGLAA